MCCGGALSSKMRMFKRYFLLVIRYLNWMKDTFRKGEVDDS